MLQNTFSATIFTTPVVQTQMTVVSGIQEDSYIVHILSNNTELNIGILFKDTDEDLWNLVCNTGKFTCQEDGYIIVRIPNTGVGNVKNVQKNKKLLSHYFPVYQMPLANYRARYREKDFLEVNQTYLEWSKQLDANSLMFKIFIYLPLKLATYTLDYMLNLLMLQFMVNARINTKEDLLKNLPTVNYLTAQGKFNNNLSYKEKEALKIIGSKHGDIINTYLRNGKNITPAMTRYYNDNANVFEKYYVGTRYYDESLSAFLEDFIAVMKNIFQKVPTVDKSFVVYRGILTNAHFHGTVDNIYVERGYPSSSVFIAEGLAYAGTNPQLGNPTTYYLSKIHVPVGARVIFNQFAETQNGLAILFPDSSFYLVTKDFQPQNYIYVMNQFIKDTPILEQEILTNEYVLLLE